jgi:CARDB
MRHGRLIGLLGLATALLTAAPAMAQDGQNVNVRAMVLSETRIAPAAQQLFQVTLANTNKQAIGAGLKVELRDDHDRRVGSPITRKVVLPAKDEERYLFTFHVPELLGDYAVRFEVLTEDFKAPLIPGGPVFFSPFAVGQGPPRPRPASVQQPARATAPNFLPPSGLRFERPDLLWESLTVTPRSLLVGEPLRIKADLRNVGGDIARNAQVRVTYFNTRTPNRSEPVSETTVQILAPGEKLEMEFETVLPDDALLGEYRVTLNADATDTVEETDENNNQVTTDVIRLTRIKLIFPEANYVFEEQGLFLFRWDSLRFNEFKVQVGTDPTFGDPANFFDLPQGEKWSHEKEVVPLEGELPAMAQGLMVKTGSNRLYWRVAARDSKTGRTDFSEILPFTITPEPKPKETAPPATPQGGPAMQPAAPAPAESMQPAGSMQPAAPAMPQQPARPAEPAQPGATPPAGGTPQG